MTGEGQDVRGSKEVESDSDWRPEPFWAHAEERIASVWKDADDFWEWSLDEGWPPGAPRDVEISFWCVDRPEVDALTAALTDAFPQARITVSDRDQELSFRLYRHYVSFAAKMPFSRPAIEDVMVATFRIAHGLDIWVAGHSTGGITAEQQRELVRPDAEVLADLHRAGVQVESIEGDLTGLSRAPDAALPILLKHLQAGGLPDVTTSQLARAMAVPASARYWEDLRELYLNVTGSRARKGLAQALGAACTLDRLDDLIVLAGLEDDSNARWHLLYGIAERGGERGDAWLRALAEQDSPQGGQAKFLLELIEEDPDEETEQEQAPHQDDGNVVHVIVHRPGGPHRDPDDAVDNSRP